MNTIMQMTEPEVLFLPGCKIKVIFAFNPLSTIYACTLCIEIFLSNYATGQAIYRVLDIFLLRSFSYSVHPVKLRSKCSLNIFHRVNFAVVVSFLIIPSAMLLRAKNSLLGFLHPVKCPFKTGVISNQNDGYLSVRCD